VYPSAPWTIVEDIGTVFSSETYIFSAPAEDPGVAGTEAVFLSLDLPSAIPNNPLARARARARGQRLLNGKGQKERGMVRRYAIGIRKVRVCHGFAT